MKHKSANITANYGERLPAVTKSQKVLADDNKHLHNTPMEKRLNDIYLFIYFMWGSRIIFGSL